MTTFYTQNLSMRDKTKERKRVCLPFVPEITNKLKDVFKKNNMEIVYSNNFKLKNLLGSTKDKVESLEKPGIYQITCAICGLKYYGQTRRTICKRFSEHQKYIQTNQPRKSAFANHVLYNEHFGTSSSNIKLLKQISDPNKLDAYEVYYIQNDADALNLDRGNIDTDLFRYV